MINILDADAIDKLAQVEGEPWRRYTESHPDQSHSFFAIRFAYAELAAEAMEAGYVLEEYDTTGFIIYGEGGYSRYRVRHTGEIVLLANTARAERIERAREAGFTVV